MKRFVTGQARGQCTLFPECLEDFVSEDNPVRVVDVFVEELDHRGLGFTRVDPLATGRPAYHPAILLKLYIVRHEVARAFIREDPVFCHRYPTGPCVGGNPGVRSARDNVASADPAGVESARARRGCQPHGGRELGLEDKVKVSEPLMSRR